MAGVAAALDSMPSGTWDDVLNTLSEIRDGEGAELHEEAFRGGCLGTVLANAFSKHRSKGYEVL
eukprot:2932477-Rhodomonas_salina.2